MPERYDNSDTPFSDHDRVVDMTSRLARVETEIMGLRSWRHDIVAPVMMEIQAQQKLNSQHIGKLTQAITDLTLANAGLMRLPDDFRDHQSNDDAAFDKLSEGLASGLSAVHQKLDINRAERAEGQKRVIIWLSGLLILGLAGIVGAQWALISPHLSWH